VIKQTGEIWSRLLSLSLVTVGLDEAQGAREACMTIKKGQHSFICYLYALMACKETVLLYNHVISDSGNVG